MITAIINNDFSYIFTYLNTNAISVRKYTNSNSFATLTANETISSDAFMYGGGTLIQDNDFSDIIGCPYVDSGLMIFTASVNTREYSDDTTL